MWLRNCLSLSLRMCIGVGLATVLPSDVGAQQKSDSASSIQEYKPSSAIELGLNESKLFTTKDFFIIRTSTSDPSITEPVVVAENQFVLLGKEKGTATLFVWGVNFDHEQRIIGATIQVTGNRTTKTISTRQLVSKENSKSSKQTGGDERPEITDYSKSMRQNNSWLPGQALPIPTPTKNTVLPKVFNSHLYFNIKEGHSRAFRLPNGIIRTSINNSTIADVIVVSKNELILTAKKFGKTSIFITDKNSKILKIDLTVESKQHAIVNSAPSSEIKSATLNQLDLDELSVTRSLKVKIGRPLLYRVSDRLIRISLSDSRLAEIKLTTPNEVWITGKAPGKETLLLWDSLGNREAIELLIGSNEGKSPRSTVLIPSSEDCGSLGPTLSQEDLVKNEAIDQYTTSSNQNEPIEIERWVGGRKWIIEFPKKLPQTQGKQ